MALLLVVIALIFAGAYFLLRTDATPPPPAPVLDPGPMRDALRTALAEASPAWTWEDVPGEPLQLSGLSAASGERKTLDLSELAQAWSKLKAAGDDARAGRAIDAFAAAVVGDTGEETEGPADAEWALQALALRLDPAPAADAITLQAHGRSFTLVLRQPTGPEPVGAEELKEWSVAPDAALARAQENLAAQVADGLHLERVSGTEDAPDTVLVAPEDPLSASLVLAPGVAKRLEPSLGAAARLWILDDGRLAATRSDAPPAGLAVSAGPIVPA